MSLGLLFPGQGSQHASQWPWLDGSSPAQALLGDALGGDWRQHTHDTAWCTRNGVAQPLITGLGLAGWQQLRPLLPAPRVVAGYSVGELAAFCAAGVFDAATALQLACQRAALMDACTRDVDTGLMSVSANVPMQIEHLCQRHGLSIAIRISAWQAVIGGLRPALLAAERDATQGGARCVPLAVALASHTHWLAAAVAPLAAVLQATAFATPHTALVCNLSGNVERQVPALRHALGQQIGATVRWDRSMETMAEYGVTCVLEVGPGAALSRQWNLRFPKIPARALDEFQHASGAATWAMRMLDSA